MKNHQMTKLHRAGFFCCLSGVVLAFAGFWTAGTIGVIEFSSQYFWFYVLFPLLTAAAVTGLSWKWSVCGGSIGVVSPVLFFFIMDMDTLYRYLFGATIIMFFTGGVILLIASIKRNAGVGTA
jgi:hypothetical protein